MDYKFLYPVDTDQFADIREQGLIYVDKTDLMYDIARRYRYVFLSRPRRFGKSLLCNTLDAYFNGRKELFEGLKIMELEHEWKKYPVFHFIMSGLKNLTVEEAKGKLELFIRDYENIYGSSSSENTPGARFRGLIHRAHEQTGEKVVIILDEYDAPIMRLLNKPKKRNEMRMMLREFYQVLKDEGQHIRFTFLTGVTKFSQLSIFSELNNLFNISMLPEYSGICGITDEELTGFLRPCVEDFASGNGCSVEEAYRRLKKQYDGYHFCAEGRDVYAPLSLMRALNNRKIDSYWFETGTSSALLEYLRLYPTFNALYYDGIEVGLNQFNIPIEDSRDPIPLLYQSGYLSIDGYNSITGTYRLHFPNKEVRTGMVECLAETVIRSSVMDEKSLAVKMALAFADGDLSAALKALRAYIGGIPYDIITKEEWNDKERRESFYKMLIYIVCSMVNSMVSCEEKSILGRSDIVVQTPSDVFVLELKVDKTVEEALAQIDDKGYAIPWSADGRRVTKCGVVISSEKRNIIDWKSVDANGQTLDEQVF